MKRFFLVTVMISAVGLSAFGGGQTEPPARTGERRECESRPIELADPHIFLEGNTYYLYGTGGRDGFMVYTSRDLVDWQGPVGATEGYALYRGDSFGERGFWAPQVFKRDGRYYMAYTASEQIAIAGSDSPLGPFRQTQIRKISGEGRQIDPFVWFEGGKAWLYHVRLHDGNKLFVAELEPDLSDIRLQTARLCIEAEPGTWEDTQNVEWRVVEGPTVLKRGEVYYFLYSANHFQNPDYAVGYATGSSPVGEWTKHPANPLIDRTVIGRNGTGHGDVFTDREGNLRYVFHYHASDSQVDPRRTAIVDLRFTDDGRGGEVLAVDPQSVIFLQAR